MKKRITVWVIVFLCAVLALAGSAASEKSGECGTGVTWSLSDKGLLTISGSGKITAHPWTDEETISLVKEVSIGKGITGICDSAFEDCSKLTKVTLPDTLASIGAYAFPYWMRWFIRHARSISSPRPSGSMTASNNSRL